MPTFLRRHGFTLGLVAVVVLGGLWPEWVTGESFPRRGLVLTGVVLIFFLQGLVLPLNELARGFLQWRHHLLVLGWNFVGASLLATSLAFVVSPWLPDSLFLGLIFLGLLPTTISSAVALTAAAGGSVPHALVATVASNLLGVVLSPTLAAWAISNASSVDLPLLETLLKVALQVLVPLGLGQLLRPYIKTFLEAHRNKVRPMTNGIILMILYLTFAQSFADGIWQSTGVLMHSLNLFLCLLMLAIMSIGVWQSTRWLKFPRDAQISAFYCSSQKGLAMGIPMAGALLSGVDKASIDLGLFVLPLICYHVAELLLGGFLAARWQNQGNG